MRSLPLLLCLAIATPALGAGKAAEEGRALRLSGRYVDARRLLEAEVARDPRALAARLELGQVYRATGETQLAERVWNEFFDDYEQGRIDKKSARELTCVAQAARFLGATQDANDTFRDAVQADPKGKDGARANIAWAELFLEKYDAGHAEVSLDEALKILPEEADAHILYAKVKLEQDYDVEAAEREIVRVLAKSPRHEGALALKALLILQAERIDEAKKAAQAVLQVNPESIGAHMVLGTAALLRDDQAGWRAVRDRVLKTNPHASSFFHQVAEELVRAHRYTEANLLEAEALRADPKDPVARAAIGANLLRLGDEKAGLQALEEAWKGDKFNVRTFNLLELFDRVIPKDYELVEGTPFRFRVPKREREVLLATMRPLVEREYRELKERYGFAPTPPITIEIFTNPEHYAVRTIGLPRLDALGVTFGQVVTAMSPSGGKFNWGMMIWHEVAHTFSIQLSKSKVPRWFTEGLSEYETARHDPAWTRRTHAELYRALKEGRLLSVRDLSQAFSTAKDVSHIVVAYHQAAEEVTFLARRFGFGKVVEALRLFGDGKETPEVIERVTGLSVVQFDAAFRQDLKERLAPYVGTFFVRSSDYSDVDALKARLKAHPEDQRAKGLYALALIKARAGEEAAKLIEADLLERIRNDDKRVAREVILAGAELVVQRKDWARAKLFFTGLIANGGDGYDARFGLGRVAAALNDLPEAQKQLALAKQLDPDRSEPYELLARLYEKVRPEDAVKELEEAIRLDVMDGTLPTALVERYANMKRWDKLLAAASRALDITPFDAELRTRMLEAHLELGQIKEAKAELPLVRACHPEGAVEVKLRALEARLAKGPPAH